MATASLKVIYRSNSHAPLWIVAEKSGAWEKNGEDTVEILKEHATPVLHLRSDEEVNAL